MLCIKTSSVVDMVINVKKLFMRDLGLSNSETSLMFGLQEDIDESDWEYLFHLFNDKPEDRDRIWRTYVMVTTIIYAACTPQISFVDGVLKNLTDFKRWFLKQPLDYCYSDSDKCLVLLTPYTLMCMGFHCDLRIPEKFIEHNAQKDPVFQSMSIFFQQDDEDYDFE